MFTWKDRKDMWKGEGIYHLTFAVVGRKKILSELKWDKDKEKAWVGWSDLGNKVAEHISEISARYPQIKICATQIMPDHVHAVLWVQAPIAKSIKEVARGFAQGCRNTAGERLFEPPYIRTLSHPKQLDAMVKYVKDNPHRAMEKASHPDLFTLYRDSRVNVSRRADNICHNMDIHNNEKQLIFTTMGNHHLLEWPDKRVVECSRTMTKEQMERAKIVAMAEAKRGVIIMTAAISEGEKNIARSLREAGLPMVVLMKDGFPKRGDENEKYYKPGGVYFEACAKGQLLLMEPNESMYEHETVKRETEQTLRKKAEAKHQDYVALPTTSARYRYVALNEMAKLIAKQ